MLGTILDALRHILGLLIKRKESQKTDIDIELARKELQDKTRLVQPASFQDVQKYDLQVQAIERAASRHRASYARRSPTLLIGALVFAVVAGLIAFIWLRMRP